MVADKAKPNVTAMDYTAHEKSYSRFVAMLKWGMIFGAITTAVVLLIIAN